MNGWLIHDLTIFLFGFFRLPRVFCTKHGLVKSGEETVMTMEYEQLAPKNEMGFSVGISIFPGVYSFYSTHFQVHFFKNVFWGGARGWF